MLLLRRAAVQEVLMQEALWQVLLQDGGLVLALHQARVEVQVAAPRQVPQGLQAPEQLQVAPL